MTVNDLPKSIIALYLIFGYAVCYVIVAYPIKQLQRVYAKIF